MHDERYEAARRRAVRRLVLRLAFVFSLIFYLLVMAVMWLSVGRTPTGEDDLGAVFATFILGSGVLFLGALAFNVFGRIIDRAARHDLEREQPVEKPKRKRLELDEDDELVEITAADETGIEERDASR